jgi:hypothetical protein
MDNTMDTETNLAGDDLPEVEDVQFEDEADEGSPETDEDGNPIEEPDDAEPETVEIERDGKTYKVPAELKDDFLRQADYTRKTQEVAELRKELGTHIEQAKQASEAEVNARAKAVAIDAAIQQYQNVDWDALQAQDAANAFQHWRKFQQLQSAKGEADTEYAQAVEQRTLATQHEAAKRIEQGIAELQRDIPDWGPKKAEELLTFGEKQFGLSRDYMNSITDPNLVKVMNFAFLASKAQSKAPAQQQPKPAAKVKEGSAPKKALDDRLNAEDWVRQRNAQLARRK